MKEPRFASALTLGFIAVCMLGISVTVMSAQDKTTEKQQTSSKSIGFVLSADATEHDLGLPIYPGSSRYKEKDGDSSALHMGMWGGGSGFKLVVLKLQSGDSPAKVAKYYHKPLSHYGKVVDCGKYVSGESNDNVDCENDHPVEGGYTFEAGTKERMHVVAVEPNGAGSLISLVYVESPKSENNKD